MCLFEESDRFIVYHTSQFDVSSSDDSLLLRFLKLFFCYLCLDKMHVIRTTIFFCIFWIIPSFSFFILISSLRPIIFHLFIRPLFLILDKSNKLLHQKSESLLYRLASTIHELIIQERDQVICFRIISVTLNESCYIKSKDMVRLSYAFQMLNLCLENSCVHQGRL